MKRGEIYWAELPNGHGSVQAGTRPVIIVSNDAANTHSPIITVVPLTTSLRKKRLPTHVAFKASCLRDESIALCEQLISIEKDRVGSYVGKVPEHTMEKVDFAMRIQLNLVVAK